MNNTSKPRDDFWFEQHADGKIYPPRQHDRCRADHWRNRVRPINSGGFSDSRYPMAITMGWHRIRLSRQEYESGEMNLLLGAFRAAYIGRNGPVGMAMFGCWADDGACYFVYTTPSSVRHITPLLDAYSASRIDKPNPIGLSLIYGDESGLSSREVGFEA